MSAAKYPARTETSEHRLQALIVDYMTRAGRKDVKVFAIPNAARRSYALAARMKAEGLTAGIPDLCFMFPGGIAKWMELKTEKGTMSDRQLGFQAICVRLGHDHAVVRNFEGADFILRQWGALR